MCHGISTRVVPSEKHLKSPKRNGQKTTALNLCRIKPVNTRFWNLVQQNFDCRYATPLKTWMAMLGSGSFEEKQMASLVYWYGNSWDDLRF